MRTAIKRLWLLWGGLFVPSLIAWGLIIRLSPQGQHAFAAGWHTLAHLLVVPLVLSPLTDRSFTWLTDGGVAGFAGFLLLMAVWALMIALPITLCVSWANWLGQQLAGDTGRLTGDGRDASALSPALRLLSFVTVPLALLGHALRWWLKPALCTFIIVFAAWFLVVFIQAMHGDPATLHNQLVRIDHAWHGYQDTAGVHPLFAGVWTTAFHQSHAFTKQITDTPALYGDFTAHPNHYSYVLWLFVIDAAINASLIAAVVGVLAVFWRVIKVLSV